MASLQDFKKINTGWDPDNDSDSDRPRYKETRGGSWTAQSILLVLIILLLLFHWFWPDAKKENPREYGYSGPPPKQEIYYDQTTGKLHKHDMNYIPSQHTEDGDPTLVRTRVFRRGQGVDSGEPYIGYLEMPARGVTDSQYKAARKNYGDDWGDGILVRRPDSDNKEDNSPDDNNGWVPANSPEGRAIIRDAHGTEEKCQQGQAIYSR